MAKKRKGLNKSLEIRNYYTANPDAKPKQVVEALQAKGVDVNAPFVSTIRSKMLHDAEAGVAGSPKTALAKTGGRLTGGSKPKLSVRKTGAGARQGAVAGFADEPSFGDLLRAKELVDSLGGLERAQVCLNALDQLSE